MATAMASLVALAQKQGPETLRLLKKHVGCQLILGHTEMDYTKGFWKSGRPVSGSGIPQVSQSQICILSKMEKLSLKVANILPKTHKGLRTWNQRTRTSE